MEAELGEVIQNPKIIFKLSNPKLSLWQLNFHLAAKTSVELGGHSGIDHPSYGFPQFPLLNVLCPDLVGEIKQHDLHHIRGAGSSYCNFSKRFAVWDHIFGTFVDPDEYYK